MIHTSSAPDLCAQDKQGKIVSHLASLPDLHFTTRILPLIRITLRAE